MWHGLKPYPQSAPGVWFFYGLLFPLLLLGVLLAVLILGWAPFAVMAKHQAEHQVKQEGVEYQALEDGTMLETVSKRRG